MVDRRRLAARCGVAAPVVAIGAILLGTLLAAPETFTWRSRALSHMGEAGTATFPVFNGGLLLGGLLGLPFAAHLWTESRNAVERVGVALLAVTVVGLIGVGVFFVGHTAYYGPVDLHGTAAATVFVVGPFAGYVHGTGSVLAGDVRTGLASIWIGLVHPVAWLAWLFASGATASGRADWFAVPEFVAAVALALWILLLARRQVGPPSSGG